MRKVNVKKACQRLWAKHDRGRMKNQDQAIAWLVVYDFCTELGMKWEEDISAIEAVLRFIYEREKK